MLKLPKNIMKKKKLIFLFLISLVLIFSCDRFDNNFKNNPSVTERIAEFFTSFGDSLAVLQTANVPEIMNFYHDDYLNNGVTKSDVEEFYNSIFALADSVEISSEFENSDDNLTISWNLLVKNSLTESVLIDSLITDKLIENRNGYLFYGNQITPPSVEIETFFITFQDTLSRLNPNNISNIMNFYHDDYLNNGVTKSDVEEFYNSIFALADSVEISSEFENSDDNLTISWNLLVKNSLTESVLIDSLITDKLIENRNGYLFYGNQITPPSAEKQKVLVQLFTGTWCPNCPYGEDALFDLSQELGDSFYFLEVHIQDELALGSNYDLMNYYGIGSLPTAVFQGQTSINGANENVIDIYRNAIQNFTDLDAAANLKNIEYQIDGVHLNGTVQIGLTEAVSQQNLFLKYSLVEVTSDILNNHGSPCRQVVMANDELDLSTSDLNVPLQFDFQVPVSLPSDAKFYLWLQTVEEPYNEESCKIYNVIEINLTG